MPRLKNRLPAYRLHKASGQAIVTLSSTDYYLGPFNTALSRAAYDRQVAAWLERGRQPEPSQNGAPDGQLTINELILAFWQHAQSYYRRPDGSRTTEVENYRQALRPLRRLFGDQLAVEFGPSALKAVRAHMVERGWARKNINKQIDRLRHVFRWAAGEELLSATIYEQLRTLGPLQRGRCAARETQPVRPVPQRLIDAVHPFVSAEVWALIQLQLLTAARPGELVALRGIDLDTRTPIWTAQPAEHKTAYREQSKTIYFGPQAQDLLRPFLAARPLAAYMFSPRCAEKARRARRHSVRRTALSCGNRPGSHRAKSPGRAPGDRYTVDSYRRAIERACAAAFPPPPELALLRLRGRRGQRWETQVEWRKRLGPDNWQKLLQWRHAHRWHPHQLRHNAATTLRQKFGVEVTRVILGHRSLAMAEVYAELDRAKAEDAIRATG